jgi:hypothetical protein
MLARKRKIYGSFRERERTRDGEENKMSSGGWMTAHGTEVDGGGDYRPPSAYALRPLSLGEILDRSFAVYRANFWLFVGIASLSAAVQFIANAALLMINRGFIPNPRTQRVAFNFHFGVQEGGAGISALLFFLAAAVTQAATVWALSEVYLGRRTTIGDSIRAVIGRWLRFLGIALWQAWSVLWLPLLLIVPAAFLMQRVRFGLAGAFAGGILIFLAVTGGLTFGIIAFLRNSLAVQAAVVEGLKVRKAMRRSKVLAAGTKGRIFVVYLIAWCLFMVAGVMEMPLLMIIGLGALKGERHLLLQVAIQLVNFVAHSAVTPVLMIGLSLVYFDQRVRQDGFDLLLMLDGGVNSGTGANGSAPPTLQTGEPASDAAAL